MSARLRRTAILGAAIITLSLTLIAPANAIPGISDCKESPTPDVPGRGIAGFFSGTPEKIPQQADPFDRDSDTTIFEQYGYAGLRWHTYDLGCGPDAMRQPDAVIGTAMSNWLMQAPIALTALTGSLTKVAFEPTFLSPFDGVIGKVSTALHDSLFASWIPAVIALVGAAIIFRSRRASLATTAAAAGWALIVILMTTALFRWPVEAGHAADAAVTSTLGTAASQLNGRGPDVDPGTAVASAIVDTIFYRAWLAGTVGSPDSQTARKYGPDLFKAHALTWREAAILESDPERGKKLIEQKKDLWEVTASKIRDEDPEAYEHLTGRRSETRVGYAVLAATGAVLALPFLLLSALLMIGCFLIVRLAVMLFPAFATLGAFPAARGLVTGLGTTVAAAVVNAIMFGIGACVTVVVLGILLKPGGGAPGWLGLVLMPVFSFIMWMALRPFRRLTTMVSPSRNQFGNLAGSLNDPVQGAGRLAKRVVLAGVAGASGGAAAGAVVAAASDDPPDRAEARPGSWTHEAAHDGTLRDKPVGHAPASRPWGAPVGSVTPNQQATPAALPAGFVPKPTATGVPPPPTEPEWNDGELYYPIYRPDDDDAEAQV